MTKHGFRFDPISGSGQSQPVLLAANNSPLTCLGEILIHATTDAGISAIFNAIVVDNLSSEVLVSWHDLQALGIISQTFPASSVNSVQRLPSPTEVENDSLEKIKADYRDVLGGELKDKPMAGPPMHIHLKDNSRPFRISTARPVPLRFQEEADKVVQDLLDKHVIVRVTEPTEWTSPAFFVPKSDNKRVRLVTDYSRLNQWVRRPVHPFPSSRDIIRSIPPDARYFAKLDLVHGYFQVELDEPSSFLTTFLLPSGRYRYLRAPMGLSSSSDEFCSRTDVAIAGIPDCNKIVDDILTWSSLLVKIFISIRSLLNRCREHNICISLEKLEVGTKMRFAGYIVSADGISPDPQQTDAISRFPVPQCIKDLRAFLGLVNQLAGFVPDITQMSFDMRKLLKKNVVWQWLPEMQAEFEQLKRVLTSDLVVKPFDPSLDTFVITDAARLHGLGFGLFQRGPERNHLVQCGSCSLNETQSRYATIELECLGIVWALGKLDFFLRGLPHFYVLTDHRPLEGIFLKEIFNLDNHRLQRMREKVVPYTFTVKWISGKDNIFADVLSRFPVFGPESDDSGGDDPVLCFKINTLTISELFRKAKEDSAYQIAVEAVKNSPYKGEESEKKTDVNDPIQCPIPELKQVWDRLSLYEDSEGTFIVLDAERIFVPANVRQQVLAALHSSHSGLNKTQALAKQLYFWPNINNDIKNVVSSCRACRERLPSLPPAPLQPTTASTPMAQVGTDLFEVNGQHWLLMVDRFSGYIWAHRLAKTTSAAVISRLRTWFLEYGFPTHIRSDGGPQYRSEFNAFCEENGIVHELTSPYMSQSNGLAEAGVKSAKRLLSKCLDTQEDFPLALQAWRNTPRADGYSPAQLFYGRRQRSPLIPSLPLHHEEANRAAGAAARKQTMDYKVKHHDQHVQVQVPLVPGQHVHVQNPFNKRWDTSAVVESIRPDGMSYIIKCNSKTFIRNRKFLRPANSPISKEDESAPEPLPSPTVTGQDFPSPAQITPSPAPAPAPNPALPSILRRSSRIAAKSQSVSFDLPHFTHR